jgi:exonuclease III
MRIVSWNCGGWSCGGFTSKKYNEMMRYNPEILLIQECTKEEFELVCKECKLINSNFRHWYGDNHEDSYKGMAIFFSFNLVNVELVPNFNEDFRYVVPYKILPKFQSVVQFPDIKEITLLSVWTKKPSDGSWDYQKTIFDALDYYNFSNPIVLAGDFNTGSNSHNIHRCEELKTHLKKYGLKNCAENSEYEHEPTFYHDKTNSYFTNDFCFISEEFNVYDFFVDGMNNQKRWRDLSDHCPIIADFGELTKEYVKELDELLGV